MRVRVQITVDTDERAVTVDEEREHFASPRDIFDLAHRAAYAADAAIKSEVPHARS